VILVDSSFFVGLADAKDRWHADALRLRQRLRREPVVSDLCLAEAATILGKRKNAYSPLVTPRACLKRSKL